MCTMYVSGAIRGQKVDSDPLVLELRMVVSHHVCDGNQTLVLTVRARVLVMEPSLQCFLLDS